VIGHKHATIRSRPVGRDGRWPIGETFVHESSIWRVMGMFLIHSPSGDRQMCWIIGQQQNGEIDSEGEA
jgi:hypothetical protein